jgi:radical SAM enzyme (TIGR01210 family)
MYARIAAFSSSFMRSLVLPTDADVMAARPAKNAVDPRRPEAFFVEPEHSAAGRVEDVSTLFLTNRECPFRCTMCDLWRNTTDATVPLGAIVEQIDFALARLPPARHVKLYNSGNWFDAKAIPRGDWRQIAARVRHFATVIVENHPRLCGDDCLRFRDLLDTQLEIALGLETIHPQSLAALNKRMTVDDFELAARFLVRHGIAVRAFVLLRSPLLDEAEGLDWAMRSVEFALAAGVGCCVLIPTRTEIGLLRQWQQRGLIGPPKFASLEFALEQGLQLAAGRVFADLWNIEASLPCPRCGPPRVDRLRQMNLSQQFLPRVVCDCETT